MSKSPAGVPDALQELADAVELMPFEVIEALRHYSAVYAATCQQAVSHLVWQSKGMDNAFSFENVIVDEAARANPLDLFIPMSLAKRRIVLVGDHRQLPHLLEPDIERELGESTTDAATKALKTSLFERLFSELRAREQRDGIRRVVMLDKQFRMHPVLGDFVRDVFYKPHQETFSSPLSADLFQHNVGAWTRGGRPVCAAWKNIPFSSGGEARRGTSWERVAEARWIAEHVSELLDGDAMGLTVGVISFYKAQVTTILEEMQRLGLSGRDDDTGLLDIAPRYRELDRDGKAVERLRVGTVDSFQGMEFDIVLLSVVRSNLRAGDDADAQRRKYGHLQLPNRLCVAMSRQKKLLITVGDKGMFDSEQGAPAVPGLTRFLQLCGGQHGLVT
jgi:superfamily I DNA and/or RNA helicase